MRRLEECIIIDFNYAQFIKSMGIIHRWHNHVYTFKNGDIRKCLKSTSITHWNDAAFDLLLSHKSI